MSEVIISVDLGGTNIRVARLDMHLNIQTRLQTDTAPELGCMSIIERIKEQIRLAWPDDGSMVRGIGISAPGPINPKTGVLVAPPNLGDCYNVPIRSELQQAFNVPTFLGNDANVAILAEMAQGSAQGGYRDAIFITVSTGIGGGVVSDGRLLLGSDGLGAEVGHIVIIADGKASTLEKEAAGPALARQARRRIEAGESSSINQLVGGDLSKITGKVVGEAAGQGDPLAVSVIAYGGRIVGLGIVSLLHLFNPEIIVIGGGVSRTGDLLFNPMWDAIKEASIDRSYWENLKIVPAALGDNVSIYGAAALVLTEGGKSATNALEE
jgi:glucokinase